MNSMLKRFLGEADETEPTQEAPEAPAEETELPVEGEEAPPAEALPEEPGEESEADELNDPRKISPVAEELVVAWQSGGKTDVAQRLMYTPISYVDFVQMCFAIGQDDGQELATLLDQLAEGGEVEGAFGSRAGEKPQDLVKQMTEPEEAAPAEETPEEKPE